MSYQLPPFDQARIQSGDAAETWRAISALREMLTRLAALDVSVASTILGGGGLSSTAGAAAKGGVGSRGRSGERGRKGLPGRIGVDGAAGAAGAAGGDLVLLEQHTAAASATLNFTTAISAAYDLYLIEFLHVVPATDNVDFYMRMSTDGGATYDATGIYGAPNIQYNQGTFSSTLNGGLVQTFMYLWNGFDTTITQGSLNGFLKLYGPATTTAYKQVIGQLGGITNDGNYYGHNVAGFYRSLTAVNAFQFLFSAGNIASGTIRVYGIAKTAASGTAVQVVNTTTGAVASGATAIPIDDTIPQSGEGDQYMSLAITPKSATNKLRIDVTIQLSNSIANWYMVALFQDAGLNALAGDMAYNPTAGGGVSISFTYYMTAGTVSATTFKVRAGGALGGTMTFNGVAAARYLGGVMASSITITEIAA